MTVGTLLAALALAGCGGDDKDGGISAKTEKEFVAGCTDAGQPENGCECIVDELKKQGVDTKKKFEQLSEDIQNAAKSSDPAGAIPDEFKDAALECRDKLQTQ
jgi:hypothetical protein